MTGRTLTLNRGPQALVTAGALVTAAVAGTLLARNAALGMAFLAALVFVPLAFANPPLALAGWIVTLFLTAIPGTHGAGTNYVLLIVLIVWLGTLAALRGDPLSFLHRQRRRATVLGIFGLWLAFTLAWAPHPFFGGAAPVRNLVISGLAFLLVSTLVTKPEHARWLALAFIAGAVLSVLAGAVQGGLHPSTGPGAIDTAATDQGRLKGGTTDPNYLAAAIVPAIMLAGGLAVRRGHALMRIALAGAAGILAIGLVATQSRGGLLAAALVCIGALVMFRGRRLTIASFIAVLVLVGAVWFAASPGTWTRVTSFSDGGSGRSDIWKVAWRVVEDKPIAGVGLSQFPVVSPDYIRRPGAISRADLLVDKHIVVHNAYLQLWAETGIVGLLLFAAVAIGSLVAARDAARRFDARGDPDMAMLARAALLALVGALTASIFLSNIDDRRLWVLLALGPALLGIALRQSHTEGAT